MSDRLLSISEVAEVAGIRPSALRYYEEMGLIRPAARRGGKRHYSPSILRRLAIIALLQDVGFTVAELRELFGRRASARRSWRELAQRKVSEIDEQIRRAEQTRKLLAAVLACRCDDPGTCDIVKGARRRQLLSIESRPLPRGRGQQ